MRHATGRAARTRQWPTAMLRSSLTRRTTKEPARGEFRAVFFRRRGQRCPRQCAGPPASRSRPARCVVDAHSRGRLSQVDPFQRGGIGWLRAGSARAGKCESPRRARQGRATSLHRPGFANCPRSPHRRDPIGEHDVYFPGTIRQRIGEASIPAF